MGNEMFQARLNDDFAEEVNQYRAEKHMSKSETVRHGLRLLIEDTDGEDGDRGADAEAPRAMADGGAIMRPVLKEMTAVSLVSGLLLFVGLYVFGVQLGADLPGTELIGLMFSAFTAGALFFIPLMTTIPERIDRRLWAFSGHVREVLPA